MFTGIVQAVGRVASCVDGRLTLQSPTLASAADPISSGESIAVDGCCLTVILEEAGIAFDLSPETLKRTTLGGLREGSEVNLERALRAGERMGGHFVQGHIDARASVCMRTPAEVSEIFVFEVPMEGRRYLVDKGSIAINGVSLTVVEPMENRFSVHLIPFTLEHTTFHQLQFGMEVNIEYDILAKYTQAVR